MGAEHPNYKKDLAFGLARRSAVRRVLDATDKEVHVQVRSDRWCKTSNNVSIELREKGHDSGLRVSTATHWAIEFAKECVLVIPIEVLKRAVAEELKDRAYMAGDYKEYLNVIFPIGRLLRHCVAFGEPTAFGRELEKETKRHGPKR